MNNRNINIVNGKYNDRIDDDYIQGKSIVREEIDINGKSTIRETITVNITGEVNKVIKDKEVQEDVDFNPFANIGNMLNKIKSSVSRNTQIIQRNSNNVSQSLLSNLRVGEDITQEHLDNTRIKHDSFVRPRSIRKEDTENELEDFWNGEIENLEAKNPLKESFLDVFLPEVRNLTKVSSTKEYINAVLNIVSVLEEAPMILNYVVANQESLTVYLYKEHSTIASNLFAKLIINLEE